MVKWLNHVTLAAPRNGSTTHVVDPSSGTVVAGAAFTPTAGRFLVCIAGGAVTSTTPTGWTLPAGGSAVNNAGVYLWYRTATGGDTFTTTHNASNYPVVFDIYEFAATTAFIGSAAQGNVSSGGAGPSLSGLSATSTLRCAVACQDINAATSPTYTWSVGTEAVDTAAADAATDGYGFSLAYVENAVTSTFSSAATSTVGSPTIERLVFALNVPSGTQHSATGAIASTSAAEGAPARQLNTTGAALAVSAVLGTATSRFAGAGAAAAVSNVAGEATRLQPAAGLTSATSAALGSATSQFAGEGVAAATSGVSGSPALRQVAEGTTSVVSTVAGTPTVQQSAAGVALVSSMADGAPTSLHPAQGSAVANSEAVGSATVQGAAQAYPAFGEANSTSGASGSSVTLHDAVGVIPASSSTSDTAIAQHLTLGTVEVISDAFGGPAASRLAVGTVVATTAINGASSTLHSAAGIVDVVAVVSGDPGVISPSLDATGTISVVSGSSGVASQTHAAAGTIEAVTNTDGAASQIHVVSGLVETVTAVYGSAEEETSMADNLPCDWPVSYAGCPGGLKPQALASLPASGQAIFEQMASQYLWNWTGQSYGVCEITVKPCRQDCLEGISSFNGSGPFRTPFGTFNGLWAPVLIDGLWFNVGCGRCGDKCGCDGSAPLKLPGPIDSVSRVSIDGVVLGALTYYVNNYNLLVRADGTSWPNCGLEVTYRRGVPVPIGGQIAAGVLAAELAKAACNDKSCALPQRVQTVTRQGVTIAVLDAFDDVDKGHTGIWIIDSWISSVTKPPAKSKVLSPDKPRSSVRSKTWPLT